MRIRFEIDLDYWVKRVDAFAHRDPWVIVLLMFVLAAHMVQIGFPDSSKVFDEVHYSLSSLATLRGEAANAEHPPLPKLIGALGIGLFGDNWFGWRFPQVIMGIVGLFAFYLIVRRFLGDPWALGSTMILAVDPVFFIHGGTLLLDMAPFMFGFVAIELYLRGNLRLSAVMMGLAFLAREMTIFLFVALAVFHLVRGRARSMNMRRVMKTGLTYTLIAFVVFMGLLWAYDLKFQVASAASITNYVSVNVVIDSNSSAITTIANTVQSTSKDLMWNPVQHLVFIYNYHGPQGMVIKANVDSFDFAWNWIQPVQFSRNGSVYPLSYMFNSPTYFRVDVDVTATGPEGTTVKHYQPIWYRAQPNVFFWFSTIPVLASLVYGMLKRRNVVFGSFVLAGLAGYEYCCDKDRLQLLHDLRSTLPSYGGGLHVESVSKPYW